MTTPLTIADEPFPELQAALREANRSFMRRYPGESGARQPVHTVYGGGHLFRHDTARRLGDVALRALDDFAPDPWTFARAVGLPGAADLPRSPAELMRLGARLTSEPERVKADSPAAWFCAALDARVRGKLRSEPVEDFRIDFEDGYGARSDEEEDGHVIAAAAEMTRGARDGTLPPFIGIRIKPLNDEWSGRSLRTLDLFITGLARTLGALPDGFVVTLPKVTLVEQVAYFGRLLGELERRLGLASRTLRFEIMVETPQIIVDASGRCTIPALLDAGDGRISAAHFGTYDYTAGCNITAAYQTMQHDACQYALRTMQVALAGTGIWLSDGSTTIMPVPVHRRGADDPPLTTEQEAENRDGVHHAWRLHYNDVRHSLRNGFYQGWDLHPAQLPTRFAALFAFFLEGLDAAGTRLRNFVARAAQASLVGDVFDDAATGQGLLNYFLRGINSGAITADEAMARTGLTHAELQGKSFVRILRGRGG